MTAYGDQPRPVLIKSIDHPTPGENRFFLSAKMVLRQRKDYDNANGKTLL